MYRTLAILANTLGAYGAVKLIFDLQNITVDLLVFTTQFIKLSIGWIRRIYGATHPIYVFIQRADLFEKLHLSASSQKLLQQYDDGVIPDWEKKALEKGKKFIKK